MTSAIHDLVELNKMVFTLEAMVRGLNVLSRRDWFINDASSAFKANFERETQELESELMLARIKRTEIASMFKSYTPDDDEDSGFPLP